MRRNLVPLCLVLLLLASSLSCGTSSQESGSLDDELVSSTSVVVSLDDLGSIDFPVDRSVDTAVRITTPSTTDPCSSMGLWCLPFAPEGLSDCDEMEYYRLQFGLPDRFQSLGFRESNCRNEEGVRTYCCFGYWQMYFTSHYSDHQGRPIYEGCEVDEISDYNGDEPLDKQKQACTVAGYFAHWGYQPWAL